MPKPMSRVRKMTTSQANSYMKNPAKKQSSTWKPAKASTTGNYGKAVSAAAKARNAARKAARTKKR